MRGNVKRMLLLAVSCLVLTSCSMAGKKEESAESSGENVQATESQGVWGNGFVYGNASNKLFLWMQGGKEPVLLTEQLLGAETSLLEQYGEEELQQLMWSLDADKGGQIAYAPDKEAIYFPSDWWFYTVEDAKLFSVYDLYGYSPEGREKIASAVTDYEIGENGMIWYSQLASGNEPGADGYTGMENLYRYDGKEHLPVAGIGKLGQNSFQTVKEGENVVYRDAEGGLYCGGPDKLSKLADTAEKDFYAASDGSRIVYRSGNEIISVCPDKPEEEESAAMGGGINEVYILDDKGEELLLIEKEELTYSDLLQNDWTDGDEQSAKLWELLRDEILEDNIVKCRVGVFHTQSGEYTQLEKGYMLEGLEYTEMQPVQGLYFMEIIPEDNFAKIPVSQYFHAESAAEVLEDYGYTGVHAFAADSDMGILYEMARGYVAGQGIWNCLENMNLSGQSEVRKTYNKTTDTLYIRILRTVTDEEGEAVIGGEDVYGIDKTGRGRIVVESAGQALAVRDELYYTRSFGEEGMQKLFSLEDGCLAEAQGIDMDRMRKAEKTGNLYYLTGIYGIYDVRSGTLTLSDESGESELENQIYSFLLYGDECVAALQNKIDEDSGYFAYKMFAGGGYNTGRLVIIEDGYKKTLDERALFIFSIAENKWGLI